MWVCAALHRISLTPAFIKMPPPAPPVFTSSFWAPGQTRLFIFLRKSNESHMRTLLHLHTCTNSPLLKYGQSQLLPPPGRHSSASLPSFFPLLTFAMPTPPSRHSRAETSGCQRKQATCTNTCTLRVCLHKLKFNLVLQHIFFITQLFFYSTNT